MSGRHVHFPDFIPGTPSPSFSVSSLPSEDGPFTPPKEGYKELPSTSGTHKIHLMLVHSSRPFLQWNVSLPASTVVPRDPKLSVQVFNQPATEPALPWLQIISPSLPWTLTIRPTSGEYVTVSDLLGGLYAHLRKPVTPQELALVPKEQMRVCISDTYRRRCERLGKQQDVDREMQKGIKRIDFLMGSNLFMGLSPTKHAHIWRLHVS